MKKKWWIHVIVLILFGLESIFANYFPEQIFVQDYIFIPRFLMMFFIFLAVYYDEKMAIYYALSIGILIDIVFIEVLGFYLFWYPVSTYLVSKLKKVLHTHLIIVFFITLFAISIVEFGIYGFNYILQITNMPVETFVNNRLFPTLIINIVVYLFFCYPLQKFLQLIKKEKEDEEGMFQS